MFKIRETRRLSLAGATAAIALGSFASSAAAASATATLSCKFPLIGTQPATLVASGTFPASAQAGAPIASTNVLSTVTFGGQTTVGLGLIDGVNTLKGTLKTQTTLTTPSGSLGVDLTGTIAPLPFAPVPDPVAFSATAATPVLTVPTAGTATISVTALALNLTLLDAAGQAIALSPASGTVDSDGNLDTFDVRCVLSPTPQNTELASIAILGGTVAGAPVITDVIGPKPIAGVGGPVVVRGTSLSKSKTVTVGGKTAKFTVLSDKAIAVNLPALAAGSYPLVVTNAKGASAPAIVTYVKRR